MKNISVSKSAAGPHQQEMRTKEQGFNRPSIAGRVCLGALAAAFALAACNGEDTGGNESQVAPGPSQLPPPPSATGQGTMSQPTQMASMGPSAPTQTQSSMPTAPPTASDTAVPSASGGAGGETSDMDGSGGDPDGVGGDPGVGEPDAGPGDPPDEEEDLPPMLLSETGFFISRDPGEEPVLAEGVRPFEPKYWLWSDGSDKRRYIYLPPGTQIDTSDPDHWVLPAGAKLWKSFLVGTQLVETRMIERTGDGQSDWRFSTYYWEDGDATDGMRMGYKDLWINAAGTTHDIPNGIMCERCHGALVDRALGFSAIQLNHDLPGVTLKSLMDEDLLTDPVSLDVGIPGEGVVQEALGYMHANCGNCHNNTDGVPVENIPEPQLLLRVLTTDTTPEETGAYLTAINQLTTASNELGIDYRIYGGDTAQSALYHRMTLRFIEDQMPPIGTEVTDDEGGLDIIQRWIETLPPPTP